MPADHGACCSTAPPTHQAGTASGVFNTSRQIGGALAIAVFGALIAGTDFVHGLRLSLLIAAVVALAAAGSAARRSGTRTGSTRHRPRPLERICSLMTTWAHHRPRRHRATAARSTSPHCAPTAALGRARRSGSSDVGDDLFVRVLPRPQRQLVPASTGASGGGRIRVGGVEHDVTFEPAASRAATPIDAAYRRQVRPLELRRRHGHRRRGGHHPAARPRRRRSNPDDRHDRTRSRPARSACSATSHRRSSGSPTTCSSARCGSGPSCRPRTAAWSPSPRLTTLGNTDQLVSTSTSPSSNGATEAELIESDHPPRLLRRLAQGDGRHGRRQARSSAATNRKEHHMRGAVLHAPHDIRDRAARRPHGSSNPPTPSSGSPPPASADRTCGPTAASKPSTGPRRWDTSTSASSKTSAQTSPRIKPGQFVIGSFFASDNTCEICRAGYQSSCIHRQHVGAIGTQAEYARIPLADGTLVATPDIPDDDLVPSFLAASDVLGTGWFGAVAAEVGPGKTVAVVGDGAVGLLGVLAATQLGAERIIVMSRHEPRQKLACEFGATDIIEERGDDGVARIKDLTDGLGAHSVIEAVGTRESMLQAIARHPPRRPHRLRRRHPRRAPRRPAVLQPRPPPRRPRPGPPLPARPHRAHLRTARSTPARCSTSPFPSTRSPRATGPWTNAAPSRPCCGPDRRTPMEHIPTRRHHQGPRRLVHRRRLRRPDHPRPRPHADERRQRPLHAVRPHRLAPPHHRPDPLRHRRRRLRPSRGGPLITIRAGDVIRIAGGEEHWHGAAPDHFMTHIAITEGDTNWGEQLTDAEYPTT